MKALTEQNKELLESRAVTASKQAELVDDYYRKLLPASEVADLIIKLQERHNLKHNDDGSLEFFKEWVRNQKVSI